MNNFVSIMKARYLILNYLNLNYFAAYHSRIHLEFMDRNKSIFTILVK